MSKRIDAEQSQADELDALISAMQRGETPPPADELAQFTARLTQTAGTLQPRPAFAQRLEARLQQQARQTSNLKKTLPLWEQFNRSFAMKRAVYSLAGIAVLAVIVFAAVNLLRPGSNNSAGQPAVAGNQTPAAVAAAVTATPTAANNAPSSDVNSQPAPTPLPIPAKVMPPMGGGRGMGGGGGIGMSEGGMYSPGPFENATVSLDATLPGDTLAPIYRAQQLDGQLGDPAQLVAFAARMGVQGDVYYEWTQGMPTRLDETAGGQVYGYRILDGSRRVSMYGGVDMFYEDIAQTNFAAQNQPPLSFEQRRTIAERFLQERGLLDFSYVARQSYGYDVQFVALQDGLPVNNWPLLTVTVTGAGQVSTVYYRALTALDKVADGELISAESAWNYLQAHLLDGQITYNLYPSNPNYYLGGQPGQTSHWERAFEPGQAVTLFSWLQVFRPVSGDGAPLILTDRNLTLVGDRATLDAIAAVAGQNVRLEGQIGGEPGRLTLNVTAWEAQNTPFDLYLNGVTRAQDGQFYLEIPGGFRFLLNNAPADLPADQVVSVYSWGARATDGSQCQAIIDWLTIDLSNPAVQPAQSDPAVSDPYVGVSSVSLNAVTLAYHYVYPGEVTFPATQAYSQTDPSLLPVWYFQGVTNKGDAVEFFLPALAGLGLPLP